MDTPSTSMRRWARRLVAVSVPDAEPHAHEATLVSEKLRLTLTRFAGPEGFASLLRRALALATEECPALRGVKVNPQGRLEGLEQLAGKTGANTAETGSAAAVAITAQLLELLVTFIGETLTWKLIQEAWPDAPLDEARERIEDDP